MTRTTFVTQQRVFLRFTSYIPPCHAVEDAVRAGQVGINASHLVFFFFCFFFVEQMEASEQIREGTCSSIPYNVFRSLYYSIAYAVGRSDDALALLAKVVHDADTNLFCADTARTRE